jgi:hypothetical protein
MRHISFQRKATFWLSAIIFLGAWSRGYTADLPIEVVVGADTTAQETSVAITTRAGGGNARTLEFVVHNLHYDGMASVRMNNGAWVNLRNDTADLVIAEPGLAYGGIGGGYHTLTMQLTLPATGQGRVLVGANTLNFRINPPYDKDSSGFRVLSVRILDTAGLDAITSAWTPVSPGEGSDNNAVWIDPDTAANLSAGQAAWSNATLLRMPGGQTITAKCADCHTQDGSDLRYFGFSNKSIYQRARFHGVSEADARRLTRYIRNLADVPSDPARGRPWNPPYQPAGDDPATLGVNESMSARPVRDWAAGGGLVSVLANDAQMLPYLFPEGVDTQSKLDARIDTARGASAATALKVSDIPSALQLPDWNRWLPRVYPSEIWSDFETVQGAVDTPYEAYLNIRERLTTNGLPFYLASATRKKTLVSLLSSLNSEVRIWVGNGATLYYPIQSDARTSGSQWRAEDSPRLNAAVANGYSQETAKRAMAAWMAVKYFEIMREFDLEDQAPNIFPTSASPVAVGEGRSWPTAEQTVHPNAPHITANNLNDWAEFRALFQANATRSGVVGDYLSSAWYQLQLILNSGQRQFTGTVQPIDWDYQIKHIENLAERSGIQQPLRMVQTYMKMYEGRDNGEIGDGWAPRMTIPTPLYANPFGETQLMGTLNDYAPGLWPRILNSFIREFYQVMTSPSFVGSDLASYPRYTPPGGGTASWTKIEDASYVPTPWIGTGIKFPEVHANAFWQLLPDLASVGCDPARLNDLRAWCALAWPGPAGSPNDWQVPAYYVWRARATNWGSMAWAEREPWADPDGDGVANLLEYVMGTDATAGGVGPASQLNAQGRLRIRFSRPAGRADVALQGEYSTDLVAWSRDPSLVSTVVRTNPDGTETVTVVEAAAAPNQPQVFLRLNATAP